GRAAGEELQAEAQVGQAVQRPLDAGGAGQGDGGDQHGRVQQVVGPAVRVVRGVAVVGRRAVPVAQVDAQRPVGEDGVALDGVAGGVGELDEDALLGVEGDDVALSGRRATDPAVHGVLQDDAHTVAQRGGAV